MHAKCADFVTYIIRRRESITIVPCYKVLLDYKRRKMWTNATPRGEMEMELKLQILSKLPLTNFLHLSSSLHFLHYRSYRVIKISCVIVDTSESHWNLFLGLEKQVLVALRGYLDDPVCGAGPTENTNPKNKKTFFQN